MIRARTGSALAAAALTALSLFAATAASAQDFGEMPGFEDRYTYGNRPNGIYIPRFANLPWDPSSNRDFVRGYGYQAPGSYVRSTAPPRSNHYRTAPN